ncbi:Conserved hypothetical protein [Prochlorococcus marinus str. MIT 9313]|uniref:Uncharacterized protein n=1 Tax=Prochlorococcus marinus (strain MIT 9313) TaxID=74547 RepID=B9ERJ0_PROMM|nr:Conserved hypothetical protein [Prochlorococcus marinus str. MIT 9313]
MVRQLTGKAVKVPLWQLQIHLLEWISTDMIYIEKLAKFDYGEHVLRISA